MVPRPLQVMIVDDTLLYRKLLGDAVGAIDGLEVVGKAANGQIALSKIDHLAPDVVTLDIEMPGNGIDALSTWSIISIKAF